jgi:hypothetical protein
VVAGAVVPGNAGRGEHLEVAGIESEIVEDDVAVVDGEGGAAAQRAGNDVVAQIAELGIVLGLRVGEQQNLELRGLRPALQRKVDRDWKRTGWCHSGMSKLEVRRRSPRMVEVGDLRQSAAARGDVPVRGLDDEHAVAFSERQTPAPVRVRQHDIAPVGDHDIGDTGVTRSATASAAAVFEHDSACDRGQLPQSQPGAQRKGASPAPRHQLTPRRAIPARIVTRHPASVVPLGTFESRPNLGAPHDRRVTAGWRQRDSNHMERKEHPGRCVSQRHYTIVVYRVVRCLRRDSDRGRALGWRGSWEREKQRGKMR